MQRARCEPSSILVSADSTWTYLAPLAVRGHYRQSAGLEIDRDSGAKV
jgi:hypothetical protein